MVDLETGAFNHTVGAQNERSEATITLTHEVLEDVLVCRFSPPNAMASGKISVEGAVDKVAELGSIFDSFDFWFNVVMPNEVKSQAV